MADERDPRELRAIQFARDQYCNDDLEIDDKPAVSVVADAGIWVAAWVWVSNEEIDADEFCECGRKPEECATFDDKEADHGDR